MNPLTNMKNVLKLSERDLQRGGKTSWHDMYKGSAWIFVGGLPFDLTEGDIITVFSQYGEIVNINLIRDKLSGKSRGFCFICFEDQRSTVLSVDNLNGIKILNRTIRVDHVTDYKPPKEGKKTDEVTKRLYMEGCAPKPQISEEDIKREDTNSDPLSHTIKKEPDVKIKKEKSKKSKKDKKSKRAKKEKKSKKKKKKRDTSSSGDNSSDNESSTDDDDDKSKKTKQHSRSRSPRKRKQIQESMERNRKERSHARKRRTRSR